MSDTYDNLEYWAWLAALKAKQEAAREADRREAEAWHSVFSQSYND